MEDLSRFRCQRFRPYGCTAIIECMTDSSSRASGKGHKDFTKNKIGQEGTVEASCAQLSILAFNHGDEEAAPKSPVETDFDVSDIEEVQAIYRNVESI